MYPVIHIVMGIIIGVMIILTIYFAYKFFTRRPIEDEELKETLNDLLNGV